MQIVLARDGCEQRKNSTYFNSTSLELDGKEASEYDWWYQSTNDLWSAIERNFGIKIEGQVTASFSIFAQLVNMYGGLN